MSVVRGEISINTNDAGVDVEWRIDNFFSLTETDGEWYSSPYFPFDGETWNLWIYPNGWSGSESQGHIDLDIVTLLSGPPIRLEFSLSLKTVKGEKDHAEHSTKLFEGLDTHTIRKFLSRSELLRRWSELVPSGVLTVVCTMKKSTSAESASKCCMLDERKYCK